MEEIDVRMFIYVTYIECSSSSQLFALQKIQEQVYAHFNVKKDFASHGDLDGETKIKLKGEYIICNGCVSTYIHVNTTEHPYKFHIQC